MEFSSIFAPNWLFLLLFNFRAIPFSLVFCGKRPQTLRDKRELTDPCPPCLLPSNLKRRKSFSEVAVLPPDARLDDWIATRAPLFWSRGVTRYPMQALLWATRGRGHQDLIYHGWVFVGSLTWKLNFVVQGFITPRQSWDHQIEYFTKEGKRKKYQVCVYDNRGMGDSVCPRITSRSVKYLSDERWFTLILCSTRVLAEDAIELVDHLGWEKFHLVGLSMGIQFKIINNSNN